MIDTSLNKILGYAAIIGLGIIIYTGYRKAQSGKEKVKIKKK